MKYNHNVMQNNASPQKGIIGFLTVSNIVIWGLVIAINPMFGIALLTVVISISVLFRNNSD